MFYIGDEKIPEVTYGEMPIKTIARGDETLWDRHGGYFYVQLETTQQEQMEG